MTYQKPEFPKLFVALDVDLEKQDLIKKVLESSKEKNIGVKVHSLLDQVLINENKELFKNVSIWADYKLADIPSTVAKRIESISSFVDYITISIDAAGREGVKEAIKVRDEIAAKTGKYISLIGVTVLTSFSDLGYTLNKGVDKDLAVANFAKIAIEEGLDGVVCSAQEAAMVKFLALQADSDIAIVTPGIKPEWGEANATQSRVLTPKDAMEKGSDSLVVGTAIVKADDVKGAIERVLEEVESANLNNDLDYYKGLLTAKQRIASLNVLELLQDLGAIYYLNEEKRKTGKWARLTSGRVSPFYINIGGVVDRGVQVLSRIGQEMAKAIVDNGLNPELTVGAAMGSVRLSAFVANYLGLESVYLEKGDSNQKANETELVFKRHNINGIKKVVITEDLITKGTTVAKMIEAIRACGAEVEAVVVAVNRSGMSEVEGVRIITLENIQPFDLSEDELKVQFPQASIEESPKNAWVELVKNQ